MTTFRMLVALASLVAISACASLAAERPLFSPSDQIGPAPLTAGLWISAAHDCPARYAAQHRGRFPSSCGPFELRQLSDGAWEINLRADLVSNPPRRTDQSEEMHGPFRAIIAPATEHPTADAYSPLYVAEITSEQSPGQSTYQPFYVVIVPIGVLPATQFAAVVAIQCDDILRDGPVDGITATYTDRVDADQHVVHDLSGCVASTQASVREAARRALIQSLGSFYDHRFVYVRRD